MENERIYIYKKAEALAESVGSLYRDTRKCRDDLLNFFIVNKWFGQTLEGNGDDIYIRNSTEITERLSLWLMAYRRTDSEKTDILIERFSERYPITCAKFRKYFKEAGTYGSEGYLRRQCAVIVAAVRFVLAEPQIGLSGKLARVGRNPVLPAAPVPVKLRFRPGSVGDEGHVLVTSRFREEHSAHVPACDSGVL